jgi:polyhydroxybutyrate depolymerase
MPEPPSPLPSGDHTLRLPGLTPPRHYAVHVPPANDGHTPRPVVVMIHGAGGTGLWTLRETGWAAVADRENVLVALPDGVPVHPHERPSFLKNPQLWDDGSGRGLLGRRGVDDLAYFRALFDDLPKHTPVDSQRIYVTGFSNGAAMTFRLAAELADRIAAVAPVATHCWLKDPQPSRPVPTLYVVGAEDPLLPLDGGEVVSPWSGKAEVKPPVRETLARWAKALGCPAEPRLVGDENGVRTVAYGPCRSGVEFRAVTVARLGHHWPGGRGQLKRSLAGMPSDKFQANEAIWEFFRRQRSG